ALGGEAVPVPGHGRLPGGVSGRDHHAAVGALVGGGGVGDGAAAEPGHQGGDAGGGGVEVAPGGGDAPLRRVRTALVRVGGLGGGDDGAGAEQRESDDQCGLRGDSGQPGTASPG